MPGPVGLVVLYIALSYTLNTILAMVLRALSAEGRMGAEPVKVFGVVASLSMFTPLASLYLLSLLYPASLRFPEFIAGWLRLGARPIALFLLAPLPPIAAALLCLGALWVLGMLDADRLRLATGSEHPISWGVLRVAGLGYAAGLTANAVLALGEEYGWRAFMSVLLVDRLGLAIPMSMLIVGAVWGLWHVPLVAAARPVVSRLAPWARPIHIPVSYVALCTILSYPLYLLLTSSHSILPPAAFHGAVNALWRLPQFVVRLSRERMRRDLAVSSLAATASLSTVIPVTQLLVEVVSNAFQ